MKSGVKNNKKEFTINQVSNLLLLALDPNYYHYREVRILKDPCSENPKQLFLEKMRDQLEQIGDIDTLSEKKRKKIFRKVNRSLIEIEEAGHKLDLLWPDLVKLTFMDGEIIDITNKMVKKAWRELLTTLQEIYRECIKQEIEIHNKNYVLNDKQTIAIEQSLIKFIETLEKIGEYLPAKVIHNIFHFMNRCAEYPDITSVPELHVQILMRPVLLEGFALNSKLHGPGGNFKERLFSEWCFMGSLAEVAMRMERFKLPYKASHNTSVELNSSKLFLPSSRPENEKSLRKLAINFVMENDCKKLKKLLKMAPSLIKAQGIIGRNLIHIAALKGHAEMINLLLAHGADLISRDDRGLLPLHYAIRSQNLASVKALIDADKHNLTVNAQTKLGETPLYMLACEKNKGDNYEEILKYLAENDACFLVESEGKTLFEMARQNGNENLFRQAKDNKDKNNKTNKYKA